MNSLLALKDSIKAYFPDSSELPLAAHFDSARRYNFYFEIKPSSRFLLYLNWDGHGDVFVMKCLEFVTSETLDELKKAYFHAGGKSFNIGKPRTTASFRYPQEDQLTHLQLTGVCSRQLESSEISVELLMKCIDPFE